MQFIQNVHFGFSLAHLKKEKGPESVVDGAKCIVQKVRDLEQ